MFKVLLDLFHQLHPEADLFKMSISEFSLCPSAIGYLDGQGAVLRPSEL